MKSALEKSKDWKVRSIYKCSSKCASLRGGGSALKEKLPAELVLNVVVPWLDEKAAAVYSKPRPLSEYHSRWSSLSRETWGFRLVWNVGRGVTVPLYAPIALVTSYCLDMSTFDVCSGQNRDSGRPLRDMRRNMFSSMLFYYLPFFIQLYCLVSGGRFFFHSVKLNKIKLKKNILTCWLCKLGTVAVSLKTDVKNPNSFTCFSSKLFFYAWS